MNEPKVFVLCYHRINILDMDHNMLAVSEENFREHLKWLKLNYEMLGATDDWEKIDRDGVVITFDDGYEDFYEKAFPILKEMHIPATVFVTIGKPSEKRMIWSDELEYLIYDGYTPYAFHLIDEKYDYLWTLASEKEKKDCYESLHFLMKNMISSDKRERWLDQMWSWKKEDRRLIDRYRMLNNSQLMELANSNIITIGAHSMTHPSIKYRDRNEKEYEIVQSIDMLSKIVSKPVELFAYPFGVANKDQDDLCNKICMDAGIKKTFSTNRGVWKRIDCNFDIKRNGVRNKDIESFKEYMKVVETI